MPTYLHAIGTTLETLTLLSALPIPLPTPKSDFSEYAQVDTAVSGIDVGNGDPGGSWRFTYLTRLQRYQLRQICPGLSAAVYVTLMTNEEESDGDPIYETFYGIMHWMPLRENRSSRHVFDVVITFTNLELVEL